MLMSGEGGQTIVVTAHQHAHSSRFIHIRAPVESHNARRRSDVDTNCGSIRHEECVCVCAATCHAYFSHQHTVSASCSVRGNAQYVYHLHRTKHWAAIRDTHDVATKMDEIPETK